MVQRSRRFSGAGRDVVLASLLESVPRILNQLDRNPLSPTYGCFDRDFWHYKVVDFPCARKQEAVLTLALLAAHRLPGNFYEGSAAFRDWALAGVRFWASSLAVDGSCSEWYPREGSFVATAFSLYAVTEALLVLGVEPDSSVGSAVRRAADFLSRSSEWRVQNQQAGAIVALHNASVVLKDERYAVVAEERLARLESLQHEEGWFVEYGGPDMGYLSLAIDYLGKYFVKTGSDRAKRMVERAASFLRWFAHPDGSIGGVYASRNTEYLIPSAFGHVRSRDCAALAVFCREGMSRLAIPDARAVTDRYLLYNGYTYVQAALAPVAGSQGIRFDRPFERYFPGCGLRVVNSERYFLILNERKGGAFFWQGKASGRVVQDSGVFVRAGSRCSHASFIGSSSAVAEAGGARLRVWGSLQPLAGQTLSPLRNVALRVFQLTVGRLGFVRRVLKERLRDRVITPGGANSGSFERVFTLGQRSVGVSDVVSGVPFGAEMFLSLKQPVQYVPSARFFVAHDIPSWGGVRAEGLSARRELV